MPTDETLDLRVLILAPIGRDGALTSQLLGQAEVPLSRLRLGRASCAQEIRRGAGAVLLTEEALADPSIDELSDDAAHAAGLVRHLAAALRRRRSQPGDDADAADARGAAQRHPARPPDPRHRGDQHGARRAARPPPPVRAARRAARRSRSSRQDAERARDEARARQPAEGRVPGDAVARAADAAQRHPRLGVAAARPARRGGAHSARCSRSSPATRSRRRS